MGGKCLLVCALLCLTITASLALTSANCPVASRIDSCSPQCKENSQCQGGKVCCTNICGSKTCTDINQYLHGNNKGDKYSSSSKYGATGTYCGNQKCGPREKCELDRVSKREKCVRN